MIKCQIEGCNNKIHSKETGFCNKHHKRFKRHGTPHQTYGVDSSMTSSTCTYCCRNADVPSKGLCYMHYKQWQRERGIKIKKARRGKAGRIACQVVGCHKQPVAKGLCPMHYRRWNLYGDVNFERPFKKPRDHYVCTIEGCKREHTAKGLCSFHLAKVYAKQERETLLSAYGHTCECCGENRSEFLAIDHKVKSGHKDRKIGLYSRKLHQWLKKNGYPKDRFRLLCHNCNQSIGHYGYCPHKFNSNIENVPNYLENEDQVNNIIGNSYDG